MGEFVWGFDNLADVSDGVTIFGSARTQPDDPHYEQAVETGRLLAQAGIPGHHRRRAGHHGGGQPGRRGGGRALDRLQHRAAVRAGHQRVR